MRPVPPTRSDHSTLIVICLPLAAHICSCCIEWSKPLPPLPSTSIVFSRFSSELLDLLPHHERLGYTMINPKSFHLFGMWRHVLFSEFYIFFSASLACSSRSWAESCPAKAQIGCNWSFEILRPDLWYFKGKFAWHLNHKQQGINQDSCLSLLMSFGWLGSTVVCEPLRCYIFAKRSLER